jgi:ABC-type nitrate/sulfonate/bicarbonate transport system ATPase subunit
MSIVRSLLHAAAVLLSKRSRNWDSITERQRRGCGTPHDIDEALYVSDRVFQLGPGTLDSFAVPAARPRTRGTSDAASAAVEDALLEQLQAAHAF